MVTIQDWKASSQPATAVQPPHSFTKLTNISIGRRMAKEVLSMKGDALPKHCTTLETELYVFDDPSASDLRPSCCLRLKFVKFIPQYWILSCPLPLDLRTEPIAQLCNIKSPFVQAACIEHFHQAAVFYSNPDVQYMRKCFCLGATGAELEALGAHYAGCWN